MKKRTNIDNGAGGYSRESGGRTSPYELRRKVDGILKSSVGGASEKIILLVIAACAAFFAVLLGKAKAEEAAHRRQSAEFEKEAIAAEERLETIPVESGGRSFALPVSAWKRFGFFLLLTLGAGSLVGELLNFSYYLRFRTDSIFWGLVLSLPVFALPIAEAGLLNSRWVSEDARKWSVKIQALVAIVLMALYVYFSLDYGDSSISKIFSNPNAGDSNEHLRMLFRVLASLCLCTICFSVALACGETKSSPNPDYESVRQQIKELRSKAEFHDKAAAEWAGEIEWIENTKREERLYAEIKLERLENANRNHAAAIENILNA